MVLLEPKSAPGTGCDARPDASKQGARIGARKLHQVHPYRVVLWKRQLLEGVESVFDSSTDPKDKAVDQPQTAELYERIGKINMQLDWLKKRGQKGPVCLCYNGFRVAMSSPFGCPGSPKSPKD